jgi:hypothetical protein
MEVATDNLSMALLLRPAPSRLRRATVWAACSRRTCRMRRSASRGTGTGAPSKGCAGGGGVRKRIGYWQAAAGWWQIPRLLRHLYHLYRCYPAVSLPYSNNCATT